MKQVMQEIAKFPKDRQDKILKLAALKMTADAHSKMANVLKDRAIADNTTVKLALKDGERAKDSECDSQIKY